MKPLESLNRIFIEATHFASSIGDDELEQETMTKLLNDYVIVRDVIMEWANNE